MGRFQTVLDRVVMTTLLAVAGLLIVPALDRQALECFPARPDRDLGSLGDAVATYATIHGGLPRGLHDLIIPDELGRRFLQSEIVPRDPWGRPYVYWNNGNGTFEIATYGKDGVVGGDGVDRDLTLSIVRGRRR